MNFRDKDFVPAMRDFLQEFKLPLEGQKIDKLMESFAGEYVHQNVRKIKSIGMDGDASEQMTLLAAQIMITTSIINKGLEGKMNMNSEQFRKILYGCEEFKL